tara:strand:- start:53 stop:310 length:258 start_codon:yes stop_codon:yes gene_type:complete
MNKIKIIGNISALCNTSEFSIDASGLTIKELLNEINSKFKLNNSIFLNENFLIAINNTEISVLNGNDSIISSGDIVSIISVSHGG